MSTAKTEPSGSSPVATDINAPRLYQSELFEECKARKNVIIRSDTGTGKTLVALLLIRWLASQPRQLDDEGKPEHAIQAFLVPTRALVEQQLSMVETRTMLRCRGVTGQEAPELWRHEEWADALNNLDVLVCTAAVSSHSAYPLARADVPSEGVLGRALEGVLAAQQSLVDRLRRGAPLPQEASLCPDHVGAPVHSWPSVR